MMETNNLYQQLAQSIEGEVLRDLASRRLYATDASIYQEVPRAVVRPKNKKDCKTIVKFANQHGMPLIPRAAGTSTAGQCVGNGIVVDVSRHMTKILGEVKQNNTIRVQPGVILDDLNDNTAKNKLEFAHDISTSNRCMIGGMIGNNACGSHSILYGTTRDHVVEVETVLSDGSLATFGPLDHTQLESKLKKRGLEGDIYRTVYSTIEENQARIKADYPKPEIIRRNTGYALDYLANAQPWNETGKPFNLAPLICGSEGTLALLTEATLQLVPSPEHKLLVCVHFNNLNEAMRATVAMLPYEPAAIELIDQKVLDCTKDNIEQRQNRFWIEGDPRAILIIELFDNDALKIEARAKKMVEGLQEQHLGYAYPIIQGKQINNVWALRKAGFGLLMGKISDKKAIAMIEDTAVAVPDLPAYVKQIQQIMAKSKTECVYYGHASVGLLHLRPELDLREPSDQKTFKYIANQVADLVGEFKGSLSGEHGDGRVRGPYVKKMLGEEVYKLLKQIKQTFDPNLIFNPNKILTEVPIDQNLRTDAKAPKQITIKTQFDWQKDLGLKAAAEKCNGSGVCRKSVGRGTMCPSYMATKEEFYSTRGRANLLMQALNSENPLEEFASEELKQTLEWCLSCKACKSECPANVDVARLKSEFLHHYYSQKGMPLKTRLLSHYAFMLKLGAFFPKLTNLVLKNKWLKKPLQFSPKRQLPEISTQSLKVWWKKTHSAFQPKTQKRVALLCDLFTQYHDPKVGEAAIQFLEYNGYEVIPIFVPQSPCLLVSQGLLDKAKKSLKQLYKQVEQCDDLLESGISIIGIEPPEVLTLKDGAIDLVEPEQREKMRTLAERIQLFEEFILQEISKGNIDTTQLAHKKQDIVVHVHCHQKSLTGINNTIDALNHLPGANVTALKSGCCGMSGTFGYEHYDLSMKIGEMQLFPAIREVKDKATVVATGTSCRHQIADGTAVKALHPAQVFWNYVN
jgi:FAD/FMN-containing dehydrogenase/Fe-S oxidoreductase